MRIRSMMSLSVLMGLGVMAAAFTARADLPGDVTIQCDSSGYAPASCPIGFSGAKVTLLQQQSQGRGQCIEGSTWRTDGSTIFVSGGCRATFRAMARVYSVNCDSSGYRPQVCPVSGPVLNVRMLQQMSTGRGQCVQGSTWRFDSSNIYVSDGCRAVFEVTRDLGDRPQPPPRPYPPGPQPRPQPGPQPGRPYPPGHGGGHRRDISCESDRTDVYQGAFAQIKQFAADFGGGLGMMSQDATNFAIEQTRKFSCDSVALSVREARKIRQAAADFNGMGMNTFEARTYTQQAMDHFCYVDVDYATEARKYYQFATSPSGMGMNPFRAHEYVRQQIDRQFLSCPGRVF
jgi:hypothetical protein